MTRMIQCLLGICLVFIIQLPFLQEKCNAEQAGSNQELRYLKPLWNNIKIEPNIQFGEVKGVFGKMVKLGLDIYSPDGDVAINRPAIIWIHGGGFQPGNDKTQNYIVTLSKEFAKRGYVSIAIDYRVRVSRKDLDASLADAVNDARLALEWTRTNATQYGINPNQIIISGGSAGGAIADTLCYSDIVNQSPDHLGIVALVGLWAAQGKLGKIDQHATPALLIHGTADQTVPFEVSTTLATQLKNHGVPCRLYPIEGADHTPVDHMNEIVDTIAQFLYPIISVQPKTAGK